GAGDVEERGPGDGRLVLPALDGGDDPGAGGHHQRQYEGDDHGDVAGLQPTTGAGFGAVGRGRAGAFGGHGGNLPPARKRVTTRRSADGPGARLSVSSAGEDSLGGTMAPGRWT